jgi:hypothetical protein
MIKVSHRTVFGMKLASWFDAALLSIAFFLLGTVFGVIVNSAWRHHSPSVAIKPS